MEQGLLLIDKERGWTSHDVVQRVRRVLCQKKVGHCGTLDPNATGLLLLTLGWATRLTRFLIRAPKVYEGVIRLGVTTDTYDAAGEVAAEHTTAEATLQAIEEAMSSFVGTLQQKAPPFSAKKVGGTKFYELARRGEAVPEEAKEVTVFEYRPLDPPQDDLLPFRLSCSSGTYARSLAHELGLRLGCGAHLESLRRLKIGPFELADALSLEALADRLDKQEDLESAFVPFDAIPLPFGEVTADQQQEQRISHGQSVLVRELEGEEGDWVKLVNRRQQFIAVGTVVERIGQAGVGIVQPRVVFK